MIICIPILNLQSISATFIEHKLSLYEIHLQSLQHAKLFFLLATVSPSIQTFILHPLKVLMHILGLFSFFHPYFSLSTLIFLHNHNRMSHVFTTTCSFLRQSRSSKITHLSLPLLHFSLTCNPPMSHKKFLFNLSSARLYHVGHTPSTSPIVMPPSFASILTIICSIRHQSSLLH